MKQDSTSTNFPFVRENETSYSISNDLTRQIENGLTNFQKASISDILNGQTLTLPLPLPTIARLKAPVTMTTDLHSWQTQKSHHMPPDALQTSTKASSQHVSSFPSNSISSVSISSNDSSKAPVYPISHLSTKSVSSIPALVHRNNTCREVHSNAILTPKVNTSIITTTTTTLSIETKPLHAAHLMELDQNTLKRRQNYIRSSSIGSLSDISSFTTNSISKSPSLSPRPALLNSTYHSRPMRNSSHSPKAKRLRRSYQGIELNIILNQILFLYYIYVSFRN